MMWEGGKKVNCKLLSTAGPLESSHGRIRLSVRNTLPSTKLFHQAALVLLVQHQVVGASDFRGGEVPPPRATPATCCELEPGFGAVP